MNRTISLEEIEKQLKKKIEEAERFENLLLGKEKQIEVSFTQGNTNYLSSHNSHQTLLGMVRAVRGAVYLALNALVAEQEKREILLKEASSLPAFGFLLLSEEEKGSLGNTSKAKETDSAIKIKYTKTTGDEVKASITVSRDYVLEVFGKVLVFMDFLKSFYFQTGTSRPEWTNTPDL